jgi:hypothetical protein
MNAEFRDPSMDVIEWPDIVVTESEFSTEELERWKRKQSDFLLAQWLDSSPE